MARRGGKRGGGGGGKRRGGAKKRPARNNHARNHHHPSNASRHNQHHGHHNDIMFRRDRYRTDNGIAVHSNNGPYDKEYDDPECPCTGKWCACLALFGALDMAFLIVGLVQLLSLYEGPYESPQG
ncbi:hypothetical protein KIPB_012511 [Kipferlia bialata]|uniref:Uncharacterized protein n=1 Tax=Kipferlia bialata TaxID=797122 RepID=A0A9K3GPK8_9EUKA|nr:hypothetical protein KIPB_012511 [Kipferlia bialata]|eukprot:g12511.t1